MQDLELVQFHPTGMVTPQEAAGTLVTEAVRGEGGRLVNADGDRFMVDYDAERMELSTRDRVALGELHRDHGGARRPQRRRVPRHHPPGQGVHPRAAAAHVPAVHRVPAARHLHDTAWRSHPPRTTRWAGSWWIPRRMPPRSTGCSPRASARPGCTAPTGSGATRSPRRSCTAGAPARPPPSSRTPPTSPSTPVPRSATPAPRSTARAQRTELARALQRELRDLMWEHAGVVATTGSRWRWGSTASRSCAGGSATSTCARPRRAGATSHTASISAPASPSPRRLSQARSPGARRAAATTGADFPDLDPALRVNLRTRLGPDGGLAPVTPSPVPPVPAGLEEWLARPWDADLGGRLLE